MSSVLVAPGEGRVLRAPTPNAHSTVTIKLASDAMTVFEAHRPKGDPGGPELHSHPRFDETFYVVSGEWEFTVGEETSRLGPGAVVYVPRGVFHGFRSTGEQEGRFVGVAVPGGIEHYFEEAARASDHRRAAADNGIVFKELGTA